MILGVTWLSSWSCASVSRLSSAIEPAISTPVGPAPISTKVSSRRTSSGSSSVSARSKASSRRARNDRASAALFSAGARAAQSSWPNHEYTDPVASTRVS